MHSLYRDWPVVSGRFCTPLPLYSWDRTPATIEQESGWGPTADLDVSASYPVRDSNPDISTRSQVNALSGSGLSFT